MTTTQKNGLWNYYDLLSSEGCTLVKTAANPSTFDVDSDLCLRSLGDSGDDLVSINFIPPATRYQFIEIDLIALLLDVNVVISVSTDSQDLIGLRGEAIVWEIPVTHRALRTYRFSYIGEIEAFIFSGFTEESPVNVKAIRFYSTPINIIPVIAPETEVDVLDINTAHMEQDTGSGFEQVARVGNRYEFDVDVGTEVSLRAVFTMDTIDVSHGLIKILLSQENGGDVSMEITDQIGPPLAYNLVSGYSEIFITGELKIIPILVTSVSATENAHICIELYNFQAVQRSNAFGPISGRVVSPLADQLRVL